MSNRRKKHVFRIMFIGYFKSSLLTRSIDLHIWVQPGLTGLNEHSCRQMANAGLAGGTLAEGLHKHPGL